MPTSPRSVAGAASGAVTVLLCCGLLMLLGLVSLTALEPRFTMAGLMNDDDALAQLLPPEP